MYKSYYQTSYSVSLINVSLIIVYMILFINIILLEVLFHKSYCVIFYNSFIQHAYLMLQVLLS